MVCRYPKAGVISFPDGYLMPVLLELGVDGARFFCCGSIGEVGRDRSEKLHVSVSPDELPGWVPMPDLPSHPAQ